MLWAEVEGHLDRVTWDPETPLFWYIYHGGADHSGPPPTAVLTAEPEHPHASDYTERFQEAGRILCCYTGTISTMLYVSRLMLLLGLLLCLGVQLSTAQHWSHGWYPGGKRELESFTTSEVSEEIKLCEAGECSYLRPQHRGTLRSFFLDVLARELQKRK